MTIPSISLPKWPAMLVHGQPVTADQAFEILVKTDHNLPDFHYASNARRVNAEYSAIFGIMGDDSATGDELQKIWYATDKLKERLGKLSLEYVGNSRILSAYIGGPHGWVNWDGIVGCSSYNIGKWPSVETVYSEWSTIAAAFPYLDLTCWLFSGEQCEEAIRPLVKFVVKDGKAEVFETNEAPSTPNVSRSVEAVAMNLILQPSEIREVGIRREFFLAGLKRLYGEIPRLDLGT